MRDCNFLFFSLGSSGWAENDVWQTHIGEIYEILCVMLRPAYEGGKSFIF